MSNMVFLQCHPDPSPKRLCRAIGGAYCEGAENAGHEIRAFDLAEIEFPVLRTQEEWMSGAAGTPDALRPIQQAAVEADHIAIVFPLWFGAMPAYTKAAIEQIFRPDIALDYGGLSPKPLMKGKSARIIITMSMPWWIYRFYFRQPEIAVLKRHIFGFAGCSPVRSTVFGGVDSVDQAGVQKWLDLARKQAVGDFG